MKISKVYKTINDFAQELVDIYLDGEDFAAVCKYDTAQKLIKKLLQFDDKLMPYNIEFADVNWDNYADEFVVANVGNELFVEPVRHDGKLYGVANDSAVFAIKGECADDIYDNDIVVNTLIDAVIEG